MLEILAWLQEKITLVKAKLLELTGKASSMCKCERIIRIQGKTSDMCHVDYPDGTESCDYVPEDIGIGGGDYIQFSYCADCGKIQGDFPVNK